MAEPTPTVYSYYSPETEAVVQPELNYLNQRNGIHKTLQENYQPGLDDLHLPLLAKYEAFARSEGVIGLDTFNSKYFTNGSSEGIFHLISSLLPAETLYQFVGEYQGYEAFANSIGRQIVTVKDTRELLEYPAGILIVSNPMSRDGRIISGELFREITVKHRVIVDLAYMGMTQEPLNLDLINPGIVAVVGSLSKPFGMYYYRIGFCYSRYPLASLYGNKWFKNALSIKLGEAILDSFDLAYMANFKNKMFGLQAQAVKAVNHHFGLLYYNELNQIKASPVWLLANLVRRTEDKYDPSDLMPFKRVDGWQDRQPSIWRFCLTPYYMEER